MRCPAKLKVLGEMHQCQLEKTSETTIHPVQHQVVIRTGSDIFIVHWQLGKVVSPAMGYQPPEDVE